MIYLVHFDRPIGNGTPVGSSRHYLGYCKDGQLVERMRVHRAGAGARILAACKAAGVGWALARAWAGGSRDLERRLKNQGAVGRFCPRCHPAPRGIPA